MTAAIVRISIAGRVQIVSINSVDIASMISPAAIMNGAQSCILNLQSLNHGSSNIVVPSGIP